MILRKVTSALFSFFVIGIDGAYSLISDIMFWAPTLAEVDPDGNIMLSDTSTSPDAFLELDTNNDVQNKEI